MRVFTSVTSNETLLSKQYCFRYSHVSLLFSKITKHTSNDAIPVSILNTMHDANFPHFASRIGIVTAVRMLTLDISGVYFCLDKNSSEKVQ